METKKLIKLSSLVFLMAFVLILTVPLTTEIFGLMNTPNTVLNLIGVFIYLISWLVVVIVEYQLYKDFKKNTPLFYSFTLIRFNVSLIRLNFKS